MYFRDQHNHNSQPQLLDVILHTLDVLAFPLHFLGCFLVYWFFLHFWFFSFLGVEVFASKHGKKDVPRKDKQVWLFKSSKTSIWDTFVFGALPSRVLQKARSSQKYRFPYTFRDSHQPCRHRQPNEHSPTSPASPADIDSHQPCRHRQCKFVWFSLEKQVKNHIKVCQRAAGPNTPTASDPKNTNSERAPVFVLLYCFLWLKLVTQI